MIGDIVEDQVEGAAPGIRRDAGRVEERGHFVGERRVGLAAEHRHLRALDGIEQTELRVDDAGMCLVAAKLDADGAMTCRTPSI